MNVNEEVKTLVARKVEALGSAAQKKYERQFRSKCIGEAERKKLRAKCDALFDEFFRKLDEAFKEADVAFVNASHNCNDYRKSFLGNNIMECALVKTADLKAARKLHERINSIYYDGRQFTNDIIAKLSLGGDMKTLEKLLSEVKF